jgi:hypothetical protein
LRKGIEGWRGDLSPRSGAGFSSTRFHTAHAVGLDLAPLSGLTAVFLPCEISPFRAGQKREVSGRAVAQSHVEKFITF